MLSIRTKSTFIFIFLLITNTASRAENYSFMDTPDNEYTYNLMGDQSESGFYFQVSIEITDTTSKNLTPSNTASLENDETLIAQMQPELRFINNTANCKVFQGPYYKVNSLFIDQTEVTYAYVISADSKTRNKSCRLEVYKQNETTPLRIIEYFTAIGAH